MRKNVKFWNSVNKDKILKWLDESIKRLKDEQEFNENSHKNGTHPNWISKDEGGLSQPMDNWWGYQSLIFTLQNITKRINEGEFDE